MGPSLALPRALRVPCAPRRHLPAPPRPLNALPRRLRALWGRLVPDVPVCMPPLARCAVSVPNDAFRAPPRAASTPHHAIFGPCEGALTPHPAVRVPRRSLSTRRGAVSCPAVRSSRTMGPPTRYRCPAVFFGPHGAVCVSPAHLRAPPRHLHPAPPSLRIMGPSCTLPRRLRAPPRPLNAPHGRLCAPPSSCPAVTRLRALSRALALLPRTRVAATRPVPPLPTLYLHHPLRAGITPLRATMPISAAVTCPLASLSSDPSRRRQAPPCAATTHPCVPQSHNFA